MSAPVTSTGVDVTAYLDEWLVQAPEMELGLQSRNSAETGLENRN